MFLLFHFVIVRFYQAFQTQWKNFCIYLMHYFAGTESLWVISTFMNFKNFIYVSAIPKLGF